jgi:hypothetical protein
MKQREIKFRAWEKNIKKFNIPKTKVGLKGSKININRLPKVLFSHQLQEAPIGKVTKLKVDDKSISGEYIPNKRHKHWKDGVRYGVEIGFIIPKEKNKEVELLEISLVKQ